MILGTPNEMKELEKLYEKFLRDAIAYQAVVGVIKAHPMSNPMDVAIMSYQIADSMMFVRRRKKK